MRICRGPYTAPRRASNGSFRVSERLNRNFFKILHFNFMTRIMKGILNYLRHSSPSIQTELTGLCPQN